MTTTTEKPTLEGFTFVSRGPKTSPRTVVLPAIPEGEFAKTLWRMHAEAKKSIFENNIYLELEYGEELGRPGFFDILLLDQLIKSYGIRTALPVDLSYKQIMSKVKDNYYVISRALVLRSTQDRKYPRNNALAKKLAEYADVSKGPALMTGFTLEPWPEDEKGYGLQCVLAGDFSVHYDDRLAGKWNNYLFNESDERGLPLHLDKSKGTRTWFTRNDGLSGLGLSAGLNLGSDGGCLASSYNLDAQVVVVRGEGAKIADNIKRTKEVE